MRIYKYLILFKLLVILTYMIYIHKQIGQIKSSATIDASTKNLKIQIYLTDDLHLKSLLSSSTPKHYKFRQPKGWTCVATSTRQKLPYNNAKWNLKSTGESVKHIHAFCVSSYAKQSTYNINDHAPLNNYYSNVDIHTTTHNPYPEHFLWTSYAKAMLISPHKYANCY